jgi:hypothetical protein
MASTDLHCRKFRQGGLFNEERNLTLRLCQRVFSLILSSKVI